MIKKNRVRPTKKQLKTIEIKRDNPKISLGKAMREAGYSEKTSRTPKDNFLELRGTETAMEQLKVKLADLGVGMDFYAKKVHEWATATKVKSSMTGPDIIVPDYQTQLAVKEDLKEILDLKSDRQPQVKVQIANIIHQDREEFK